MKITRLRVRRVTGTLPTDGPMWEDRLVRPIDIYPEYRRDPWREGGEQIDPQHLRLTQHFLDIETDDGIIGLAGPLWPDPARIVLTQLARPAGRTRPDSRPSCCGTRCTASRCTAARATR